MEMAQGWLKAESRAVAKGLCGPGADGDWELMFCLSAAALTAASKTSEHRSPVLQRHSGLNPGSATSTQLFKMPECSNKFFKT